MSYLVLARKYRPTSFADIVGQEHVVRTLGNAIKLNRVHHAFLFTGARGVGKTTTARVLARALNCDGGPIAEPCGKCASCVEIQSGSSPDVLEIDGASNTGVDNVRELRENVRYLPSRGRFKLYIIDEVHMLSQAAFNALLKTLEEPPAHVKFIFATTEPHKIPVTILSRCQRFDFRRVSVATLSEHLRQILAREGVSLGSAALATIVREAQGSVRDALSLLDQVLSFTAGEADDAAVAQALGVVDRQTIFALGDAILAKDAARVLQLVAEVDARGHDLGDVAGLLVEHLRDLMVVKVVERPSEALLERSPGELEALAAQAKNPSRTDLHRYFSLALAVAEDLGRSAYPRVSLEMGLLRLLEVEPAMDLAEIVRRLDALGRGTPRGGAGGGPPDSSPVREKGSRNAAMQAQGPAQQAPAAKTQDTQVPQPVQRPSTPVADEDGSVSHQAWAQLVERARALRPALASVLEHGRVLRFGPDGVEVGYEVGSFYWESARDAETKALVGKILAEQFGQPVTLDLVAVDADESAAPASLAEVAAEKKAQRLQSVEASARSHPAVRGALDILGGEVAKVTPLVDADESA